MMTSSNKKKNPRYWPFVRATGEFPITKASDAEPCCFVWFAPEQTVHQTIDAAVIWDVITPNMALRRQDINSHELAMLSDRILVFHEHYSSYMYTHRLSVKKWYTLQKHSYVLCNSLNTVRVNIWTVWQPPFHFQFANARDLSCCVHVIRYDKRRRSYPMRFNTKHDSIFRSYTVKPVYNDHLLGYFSAF